ncbi:hypothetical protein FIBSPDRAFT_278982 [Athelia psychrophila]|uniref:C2 domain-containing protein n=1 Tax=Athelia psychrophila TaxID=1759441 RepID=A0A165WKA5_9AGAM|nr:hypothetical protein FIBSPDRAFT_278982 [Fibularhizoctonia sp. CBS 109695]
MVPAPRKALRMGGRALRSEHCLTLACPGLGRARQRTRQLLPIPGETPVAVLRVQILGCKDLLAKGKDGSSDPFVVVSVLDTHCHTPVIKRDTSPTYLPNTATFEFPLYLSLAHQLGSIELVVWDKDRITKEYLGEAAVLLDSWFRQESDGIFGFDDPANQPYDVPLVSTRASTPATGTAQITLGFVNSPGMLALMELRDVYNELVRRSRPSLVSAPPKASAPCARTNTAPRTKTTAASRLTTATTTTTVTRTRQMERRGRGG